MALVSVFILCYKVVQEFSSSFQAQELVSLMKSLKNKLFFSTSSEVSACVSLPPF